MKIVLVGTDEQTYMSKLIVISNFAKAPNN